MCLVREEIGGLLLPGQGEKTPSKVSSSHGITVTNCHISSYSQRDNQSQCWDQVT